MEKLEFFLSSYVYPFIYIKVFLGFALSFAITYFTIPMILKISFQKNLMDEPIQRSSHKRKIPNLGGVAIFYAIALVAPILSYQLFENYKFLFPSLVILLFIGVYDDIMVMRAYKKLIAQIVVASLMVLGSDVRIRSFFGLFGVYELSYWFSVLFSIFTFIIIINAINLTDGIDGLAAGFGFLSVLFFSISYFRLGIYNFPLVVLGTIIMGTLGAYLVYNLSNNQAKKTFMGDTGSLLLGFLISFVSICFIDIFIDRPNMGIPQYHLMSAPVIAVAIISLPLVDTFNVIVVRMLNKQPLFQPDKRHIHHKVLSLGYSHKKATIIILGFYISMVVVAYLLRHININLLLLILLCLGLFYAYIPDFIKKINNENK
ncbi:glycosyltransferase family 4 protein [Elizabethkingia sp. JS20170427COW]|uniref:glycosyltransferase family 4 protein n=1 Tax=Elizabethkingia sp. JS20170427COW TaxID=2583851 RepID=UPI0011105639|nr:MraY family glycosyltransferase [Elizabethkingia sp. JS20170427COW]QCX53302.1 undecaprenyl/decaprenyl-phosphate alpha-N-acetylglucosaminyl 1-phosphate transferase [Elizabethkingia sp. JS20170427COW]